MRQEYLAKLENILREPEPDIEFASMSADYVLLQVLMNLKNKPKPLHIPGREQLCKALGGLPEHQFTILSGPTGAGKTTLISSLALDCARAEIPTYIASIEMGSTEFMKKMVSATIQKNINDVTADEFEKHHGAMQVMFGSELSKYASYDSRVNHKTMLSDILFCHEKFGTKICFIDNINYMMEVKRSQDQILEMDRVVHDFVVFCKKVPLHIVMIMHPRKTENGRLNSSQDIRGSITSIQEAANVILFNRLDENKNAPMGYEHRNCRELTLEKIRFNGRNVGRRIILSLDGSSEYMKEIGYAGFTDYA